MLPCVTQHSEIVTTLSNHRKESELSWHAPFATFGKPHIFLSERAFFHCLCAVRKGKSPAFTAGLLSAGGRAAAEAVARPDVFLC